MMRFAASYREVYLAWRLFVVYFKILNFVLNEMSGRRREVTVAYIGYFLSVYHISNLACVQLVIFYVSFVRKLGKNTDIGLQCRGKDAGGGHSLPPRRHNGPECRTWKPMNF